MFRFYSKSEVDAQVQELMEQGYTHQQALEQVQLNEMQDITEVEQCQVKHRKIPRDADRY